MAATMTKRQEKSRTNYNAVLDTSIVLFNKKGYKDTTIKDICEATGLSNGSVYHLFRNKDDILRHIYERDINISIGLTQDLEQKVQDPYHYLLNFMLDIQRLWEKTGPMLLSNKSHWTTSRTTLGCSPIQREELHTFISLAQERGTIANTSDPATLVEFSRLLKKSPEPAFWGLSAFIFSYAVMLSWVRSSRRSHLPVPYRGGPEAWAAGHGPWPTHRQSCTG